MQCGAVQSSQSSQSFSVNSEVGRVGPPLDCPALSVRPVNLVTGSAGRDDGIRSKLISRANKVDGQGPCEESGGSPGR